MSEYDDFDRLDYPDVIEGLGASYELHPQADGTIGVVMVWDSTKVRDALQGNGASTPEGSVDVEEEAIPEASGVFGSRKDARKAIKDSIDTCDMAQDVIMGIGVLGQRPDPV